MAPNGVLSCMVFAPVNRASWGARNAWLRSLEWDLLSRAFQGLSPAPPQGKDPSEGAQSGRNKVAHKEVVGVLRDKSAHLLDSGSVSRGVDSFAELPANSGPGCVRVGGQMR